jgi:threonine/homoserine/homoserine lactone efflux protein
MIPERIHGAKGRGNIPAWAFATGVISLIGLAFFAWIGISMTHQPAPESVTQDIPLAH